MSERKPIEQKVTERQLTHFFQIAQTGVRKTGKYLRSNPEDARKIIWYKSSKDTVLQADLEAEKRIKGLIRRTFSNHSILAEESGLQTKNSQFLWVIDPLDGSKNYQRGLPMYGVMIGLLVHNEPHISAITLPEFHTTVTSQKGKGTFLNGQRTQVSTVEDVSKVVVHFGDFAKTDDGIGDKERHEDQQRLADAGIVEHRMVGSAAGDFVAIVTGQADAFVVRNPDPWDFMIGRLIVEEAGGKITEHDTPSGKLYIVTNGKVHDHIKKLLLTAR